MTLALKQHAPPDSPLARWDSRWKLAAILVLSLGTVAVQTLPGALGFLLVSLLLAGVGRIPARVLLSRVGLLLLAVLPAVVFVPLTVDSEGPGWDGGPVRVSESGLRSASAIALRAVTLGIFALVLVRTGPLSQTLAAAWSLGFPGLILQVTQLAYRYAFLLSAELRRTRVALRTRGFRAKTDLHTYQTMGQALGGLLVRGGERADRVSAAMRCRGYDGAFRTLANFRTRPQDIVGFLICLGITVGLILA